ncbi:methylglutaconyl-CoA hydratase, mitochondrial isoform X2 [Dendroctonus ponderosae]|uniref:Methylglutaconyl-CoA hydratase, mitochondrial n=1 Tax=Dendroctonus ponderosae TaxID=77166 RepID=A0AAR5PXP3_DENPD|nr:methylglutaconyl-CoA hydratase, mitochondrial isoform X2 [Dendroctonus ponderosae]
MMSYSMSISKLVHLSKYNGFNLCRKFSQQSSHCDVVFNYLQGRHEGVAVIGFNRPERKNAFSMNLVKELHRYIDKIYFDNITRVVILKSMTPKIFCAGADLKERAGMSPKQVADFVTNLRGLMNRVQNISVPVLAAIDGVALGGGLEIALACDIRVASVDSKMGLVETKLAIIPGAGGTQRLPRILNPSIAKELIYTSKIIDGTTAFDLVNHVVEQDEKGEGAFHKCLSIADDILPNGPFAVQMAKQAISKGMEVDLYSGLSIEEACYAQIIPTKDRTEGLTAFKEKRKPKYQGA